MKTKPKRILILNYEFPPLGETVSTLLSIFIFGSENCFRGASPVSYEIAKGYVKLKPKTKYL